MDALFADVTWLVLKIEQMAVLGIAGVALYGVYLWAEFDVAKRSA